MTEISIRPWGVTLSASVLIQRWSQLPEMDTDTGEQAMRRLPAAG